MSKEKTPSETSVSEEDIRKAQKAKSRELFANMAKVKQYPIDHRPAGTVDEGNDS